MKSALLLLLPAALLISSCAINQSVNSTTVPADATLCVIEDPAVREGFLAELTKILDEKGIRNKVVNRHEALECEWTMTYLGRWTWDFTIYMAYAEIRIFQNGQPRGEVVYDASRGAFNFNKFIDAEPKIREMVEELLK
jgi:hypothetical protein